MAFLKFQEMPDDEAPPKRIWLDGAAIAEHFKEVTRKMKAQYSGNGSSDSSPDVDEERNGAASMLLVG